MRVLIDTNVLLDVLMERAEFLEHSANVWRRCETTLADGGISALSVANIVYILRKELTPQKTEDIIEKISLIFEIVELTAADIKAAAKMRMPDYEDALQILAARRFKADYIISRNCKDFQTDIIPAISPAEFLKL